MTSIPSGMRVLVAGAGANIFSAHRRGLTAIGADVVGVYDTDSAKARRIADEFGCPAHADVASLLNEPADLAVILAPHPFHAELAIASLQAGKHVLVEKPMAVHVAEADAMMAAADRGGLVLAVAFQQRTRREVGEARRIVEEGSLGELRRADVLVLTSRYDLAHPSGQLVGNTDAPQVVARLSGRTGRGRRERRRARARTRACR